MGLACAVPAYLTWGLTPIYFKALIRVPPFEILMHRIIWSFVFLLPLVLVKKDHRRAFGNIFGNPKLFALLLVSTLLVGINWFLFIWAINNNLILQTSLGYYINPLVNILLGTVLLKERLRRLQTVAVVLAALAVLYLTIQQGQFPWVSIALALSFGFYGLLRKVAPVGALEGLTVETLLLSLPAMGYLLWLDHVGQGAFLHLGGTIDLLLAGAALVTALPLLLFTLGARRLSLTTIGFLQYIAPSCTFLLAVFYYQEPFAHTQLYTFAMIWTALGIFTTDALIHYGKV